MKPFQPSSLLTAALTVLVAVTANLSAVPVALQQPTATFSQYDPSVGWDFTVAKAINGTLADNLGWGIGVYDHNELNTNQTAVFETVTDTGFAGGTRLTFALFMTHDFDFVFHELGRFRISITTDDRSLFADGLATGGDVTANWTVLDPDTLVSSNGATLTKLADLSVLASGALPYQDIYTFSATTPLTGITGIRLEAIEDPSLPFNGPGRQPLNGNFILSEFVVSATPETVQNCVSLPSGLVSWWRAEGNANDAVGTNNGTLMNGAAFASGKVGQAFNLDGTGGHIKVAASATLDVGQGNGLSIEGWINPTSVSIGRPIVEWSVPGDYGVYLFTWDAGALRASIVGTDGAYHVIESAPGVLAVNQFQHVAVTYDKATGAGRLLVNGVSVQQASLGSFTPRTATEMFIGYRPATTPFGPLPFLGMIDEISLYSRALSTNEIQAIYNAGSAGKCAAVTPPFIITQPTNQTVTLGANVTFSVLAGGTSPLIYQWLLNGSNLLGATFGSLLRTNVQTGNAGTYSVVVSNSAGTTTSSNAVLTVNPPLPCVSPVSGLVSWWRAETNALDSFGSNNGSLQNGTDFATGLVGQAFHFDGTNDFVVVPASSTLDVGTGGGMTIEGWINPADVSSMHALWEWNDGVGGYGVHVWFSVPNYGGVRSIFANLYDTANNDHFVASAPGLVTADNYQHFALTYSKSNGTAMIYYNGNVVANQNVGVFTPKTFQKLYFGTRPAGPAPGSYFNGVMDEVSLYNRALTGTELQAIYNAGSAGKCATTTPPFIITQPTNQTIAVGANVTFIVLAGGTSPLTYQWRLNGTNLSGSTASSLLLTNVQIGNAGDYSVVVSNSAGTTTSSSAVLTVNSPSCISPVSGLVSWWRGESNALDSVDGNHGTLAGNTVYGSGRVGQGFVFDGSTDRVAIGNPTNLQLQNLTIEAWIRRSSPTVISYGTDGGGFFLSYGTGGYVFYLGGNARLLFGKLGTLALPGTGMITDTNFHHVAVTKSGSIVTFYIDGATDSVVNFAPTFTFTTPVAIGAQGDNADNSFLGMIDDVAVYNRSLTAGEIQGIYNAGSAGKCVSGAPPVIITQPADQSAIVGDSVAFTVAATGTAPLSYQWRFNGTNLAGATRTALTLTNVPLPSAGLYSVRVTNLFGSVASSNATLTVNPASQCVSSPSGLVSWWRAETNALDAVGTNHGTLMNGAAFASGKVGQAFNFDGSGGHIKVAASSTLDVGLGGGLTIEGWINPTSVSIGRPIVEWSVPGGYGVYLFTWDAGALRASIVGTDGASHVIGSAPGVLTSNQFQHVAVTYDKATGASRLLVNGVSVQQANLGSFTPRTATEMFIGYRPATTPFGPLPFLGMIDEISLYSRALSTNEIAAIYASGRTGRCQEPPLILGHPLSQRVTVGSNVNFTSTATGTPQLRYQWQRNSTNLAGATGSALSFIVQPDSGGLYAVRVTNAFGSAISSNAVLTVNTIPAALAQTVALDEDASANLTLQGADLENDPLTFSLVTTPSHGTLTGTLPNLAYTPSPDYSGPDSFSFIVNDGLVDSAPATVALTVRPVNDPPIAYSQSVSLDEDTPTAITLGAFDVDGDALLFTVGAPAHGTLAGTPPNLTYRPHTNYFGPDSFTFRVSDGLTSSPPATVSLTVRPVNDAPVARIVVSPLTALPDETNLLVLTPVCGNIGVRLDGSRSSDVEHDPLQYLWLEGTNVLGTAMIQTNKFAPGVHEITLVVSDGQAAGSDTVTFEVLTPEAAVAWLAALVSESNLAGKHARPLLATLHAAAESFERCHAKSGINQLEAFQKQLRAQVSPTNPGLAEKLSAAAQAIIQAASGQRSIRELERIEPEFSPAELDSPADLNLPQ